MDRMGWMDGAAMIDAFESAARLFEPTPAERYMYDPALFCRECVLWPPGGSLTDYQADTMSALVRGRRVAVRSPHGAGKTGAAALTILWFALTRDMAGIDWKVIATASAWRHLSAFLMPEVRRWARLIDWPKLGRGPLDERRELLDLNLKLKHGAVTAVASNDPAKIEGAHADSLLYLIDESKTVPPETWDAIEGAFSGGREEGLPEAFALSLSTPGHSSGRFYDIHARKPGLDDWTPIHVTLEQAIAAGRISRDWAEQRKRQWGEEHPMYVIRVLGDFYSGDDDALVPLGWIEAAIERWHTWKAGMDGSEVSEEGRKYLGVDVARTGVDQTVFAKRSGMVIEDVYTVNVRDTMGATARVQAESAYTPVVDSIGVGGGVVDRLKETGVKVLAYTGSAKTIARDITKEFGFVNVRSAAYYHVRELLDPSREPTLCLPPSDELTADLTTPTWDVTTGVPPKIKIETKEDVAKRLGRSCDWGDSVVMALWADAMRRPMRTERPPNKALPVTGISPLAKRGRYGR